MRGRASTVVCRAAEVRGIISSDELIAAFDDGEVVAATRHPDVTVRRVAASMFRGEKALRYARELLPVLADEDHHVRQEALWAFATMGPDVLPLHLCGGWYAIRTDDQAAWNNDQRGTAGRRCSARRTTTA